MIYHPTTAMTVCTNSLDLPWYVILLPSQYAPIHWIHHDISCYYWHDSVPQFTGFTMICHTTGLTVCPNSLDSPWYVILLAWQYAPIHWIHHGMSYYWHDSVPWLAVDTWSFGGITVLCNFHKVSDLVHVITCKNYKHLLTLYNVIFSNMIGILSHLSYIFY